MILGNGAGVGEPRIALHLEIVVIVASEWGSWNRMHPWRSSPPACALCGCERVGRHEHREVTGRSDCFEAFEDWRSRSGSTTFSYRCALTKKYPLRKLQVVHDVRASICDSIVIEHRTHR